MKYTIIKNEEFKGINLVHEELFECKGNFQRMNYNYNFKMNFSMFLKQYPVLQYEVYDDDSNVLHKGEYTPLNNKIEIEKYLKYIEIELSPYVELMQVIPHITNYIEY